MTKRVEELDSESKQLLTASVSIPSLAVLVQELVYNSIDNGATCVAVRINMDRVSRVQVVDNGHGVQNLQDLCDNPPTNKRRVSRLVYGTKRGCLFHIVKLSEKVTVTTRRHHTTVTKVFRSYQASELIKEKHSRPSIGTTVTIENMFYNLPVRLTSVSYMDLETTKDTLLKIAVANPKVALTLKDITSGTKLFQTQSCTSFVDNFLIYSHNKLSWETMRDVKYEKEGYKLEALISSELCNKPWQIVLVNRRFVDDNRIKKFASEILLSALTPNDNKRNQENSFPVFLFSISCKPVYVDMCFESNNFLEFKDWDIVYNMIYSCITSFLESAEIAFPASDDESSQYDSPLHSMRSLLRVASPSVNISSDKAQRPGSKHNENEASSESIESTDKRSENLNIQDTPRKRFGCKIVPTKREVNNFTPCKNNKVVCQYEEMMPKQPVIPSHDQDSAGFKFKTPSPKSKVLKTRLSNAPVLNHLVEAKDKLDKITKMTFIGDEMEVSENSPDFTVNQNIFKRRSSTPLCNSRTTRLTLNISPIKFGFEEKTEESLASGIIEKKKRKKSSVRRGRVSNYHGRMKATEKFQMKTPHHILAGEYRKTALYPSKSFKKACDSGYETTKLAESQHEQPQLDGSNDICEIFSSTSTLLFPKDLSVEKSVQHHTNVCHDSNPDIETCHLDQDNPSSSSSSKAMELSDSPSKAFEIYEDVKVVKPKEVEETAAVKIIRTNPVKHKDCASSPIAIPVDRGCSPINFSQMQTMEEPAAKKLGDANGDVPKIDFEKVSENKTGQCDCEDIDEVSENDISDISDSILNCVDEDVSLPKGTTSTEIDEVNDDKLSSPCLECHTQNVMKRLDFSSQCKISVPENSVEKENVPPTYREIIPITAASHLVSSCTPWSKGKPKLTLPNKPSTLDIRKWKSSVFQTHGQGFMDLKKNSLSHMNFILDACRFNKTVFDNLNIIGQVDEKFIGCVTADDLLVLVDQHAAHERVRLECMLGNLHQQQDQTRPIATQMLKHKIPVPVSKPEAEFIKNISNKLQYLGFIMTDLSKYTVNLVAIPSVCFTDSGDVNISVDDILTSFHQAVSQIRESKGSNLALPQKLTDYLHSKACHGAIRFGDELTVEQCKILLKQLSVCDLPFQCAHGRPSFAPIIKLNNPSDDTPTDTVNTTTELRLLKLRSRFQ